VAPSSGGSNSGGYDQRGGYPDPYTAYGYPNPYPGYGGYPGYGYPPPPPRPEGYRAPPRGYEQPPPPAPYSNPYTENPYNYPPRAPTPPSSVNRPASVRPPVASPTTPYGGYDPYAPVDGSSYGYAAPRNTKPDRAYHPYGR